MQNKATSSYAKKQALKKRRKLNNAKKKFIKKRPASSHKKKHVDTAAILLKMYNLVDTMNIVGPAEQDIKLLNEYLQHVSPLRAPLGKEESPLYLAFNKLKQSKKQTKGISKTALQLFKQSPCINTFKQLQKIILQSKNIDIDSLVKFLPVNNYSGFFSQAREFKKLLKNDKLFHVNDALGNPAKHTLIKIAIVRGSNPLLTAILMQQGAVLAKQYDNTIIRAIFKLINICITEHFNAKSLPKTSLLSTFTNLQHSTGKAKKTIAAQIQQTSNFGFNQECNYFSVKILRNIFNFEQQAQLDILYFEAKAAAALYAKPEQILGFKYNYTGILSYYNKVTKALGDIVDNKLKRYTQAICRPGSGTQFEFDEMLFLQDIKSMLQEIHTLTGKVNINKFLNKVLSALIAKKLTSTALLEKITSATELRKQPQLLFGMQYLAITIYNDLSERLIAAKQANIPVLSIIEENKNNFIKTKPSSILLQHNKKIATSKIRFVKRKNLPSKISDIDRASTLFNLSKKEQRKQLAQQEEKKRHEDHFANAIIVVKSNMDNKTIMELRQLFKTEKYNEKTLNKFIVVLQLLGFKQEKTKNGWIYKIIRGGQRTIISYHAHKTEKLQNTIANMIKQLRDLLETMGLLNKIQSKITNALGSIT